MELKKVQNIVLKDGLKYSGWCYYQDNNYVPNGCGKKIFDDYYIYGNYIDGEVDGPAVESHGDYMYTSFFKNNMKTGWGLSINKGNLIEFGYYKKNHLVLDMTEYVLWYYQVMTTSEFVKDKMMTMYTFNKTKNVAEILIGYEGTDIKPDKSGWIAYEPYMGFRFKSDGSVWVGDSIGRQNTGDLLHFNSDGTIDCANFNDGKIVNRIDFHTMVDEKYLKIWEYDNSDIFALETFFDKVKIREMCKNVDDIKNKYNYLTKKYNIVFEDLGGLDDLLF